MAKGDQEKTKEPTSTVAMPKRSAVAGRWNPQGTQASVAATESSGKSSSW